MPCRQNPILRQTLTISLLLMLALTQVGYAESSVEPFLPTWRTLNSEQKQYFISGYLRGMSDNAKVLDIALEFIRENPHTAVQSLQELKRLYDLSHLSPVAVTQGVDAFFREPRNAEKSLSQAVTASR